MKRILIYVTCSLVTFNFGLVTEAFLGGAQSLAETPAARAKVVALPTDPQTAVPTTTLVQEVVFAGGRLKLVPDEVHLHSDRLRYQINVTYPQVVGSDELHIRRLNERIKALATEHYQWPLTITDEDLRSYAKHPEPYNTVDIIYGATLANESVLSLYFGEYSYRIGAAHAVQKSYVVTYDLAAREELQLPDLFKTGSNYLQFISRYCHDEFERLGQRDYLFPEALTPEPGNFESWNVTPTGIAFSFDECRVFGCSAPRQDVEIPFSEIKPILSARAMSILPISSVVKVKADHK